MASRQSDDIGEVFDHRQALASLSGAELARLREPSDAAGLRHLALHLAALGLTGGLVLASLHTWLVLPAMVAHGIVLSFLFAPLHESIHGTAFRSPAINLAVAEVAGFLLLLPPRWFRYFHLAHHRHTQDPEHDPELATPRPATMAAYLRHLTGYGYWTAEIRKIIANGLGRSTDGFVPLKGRPKVVREARIHLLGYALIAGLSIAMGSTLVLWLWVVPALLGQPFLRAYLLAEHAGLPFVADMLTNSRTTFTSGLVRFLAWNMPFHSAHHALPTIPFFRLPALTAHLRQSLRSTADGYVDAHRQIIARLRH
ncbi:MAG: fatty acid desaturase [Hyphomicrobiaceae bacterium]